jgi:hypothetical protein
MTALMIARMIADDPDEARTSSGNESAGEAGRDPSGEKFFTDGRRPFLFNIDFNIDRGRRCTFLASYFRLDERLSK